MRIPDWLEAWGQACGAGMDAMIVVLMLFTLRAYRPLLCVLWRAWRTSLTQTQRRGTHLPLAVWLRHAWRSLFPDSPELQVALAIACLTAGVALNRGYWLILRLLPSRSPGARLMLQGVGWWTLMLGVQMLGFLLYLRAIVPAESTVLWHCRWLLPAVFALMAGATWWTG